MTDTTAKEAVISEKELTATLTVADLLAVLDILYGKNVPIREIAITLRASAKPDENDNDTSSGTTATTAPGTQASTPSAVVDTAVTPLPVVAYSPIGQAATFPSVAVAAAKINVTQATQVDATPGVRVPAPTPDPLVLITQASGSNRWYCVSVGRQVGVFDSWSSVSPHVVGVSGACYSRFSSQAEAENSYRTAFNNRAVRIINSL